MERENFTKRYMSIDDCAAYTGIPKSTLYKKVEWHEIPCIRIGTKMIKFDIRTIDEWMAKQAVKPIKKENKYFVPDTGIDRVANGV